MCTCAPSFPDHARGVIMMLLASIVKNTDTTPVDYIGHIGKAFTQRAHQLNSLATPLKTLALSLH